jgi:hypothetical protein
MVSNTVVSRLAFHMALPAAMLVMLFYTLKAAEREQRTWIAQRESAHQKAVTSNDIESIPFVLPFQHSARIQDAVGLQWPAFVLAGIIAPVPQLFYSERKPITLTWASYAVLAVAVSLYWFAIGLWIDKRFIQRNRPAHSRVVRIVLSATFVLTTLLFVLFLGKDLLGGWPEGPQGAYGVTLWLAFASTVLLTEINGFRRRLLPAPEL